MRLLKVLLVVMIVSVAGCESREEARRKEAANNLKQIGLALENYRASHAGPANTNEPDKSEHATGSSAPKTERDERRADMMMKVSGEVTEFHRSPTGEVDGFKLKDGKEVRFPPTSGERVAATVSLGEQVEISGWTHAGESEVHAATILVVGSGKVVEVDVPPPDVPK